MPTCRCGHEFYIAVLLGLSRYANKAADCTEFFDVRRPCRIVGCQLMLFDQWTSPVSLLIFCLSRINIAETLLMCYAKQ